MGNKLYVGNISFDASEEDIKEFFSQSGEVESVTLITDRQTGQPRGFGFVEMASNEDATRAISELNGTSLKERPITVAEARPQRKENKKFDNRSRKPDRKKSGREWR